MSQACLEIPGNNTSRHRSIFKPTENSKKKYLKHIRKKILLCKCAHKANIRFWITHDSFFFSILAAWGYHRQGYCQAGFSAVVSNVSIPQTFSQYLMKWIETKCDVMGRNGTEWDRMRQNATEWDDNLEIGRNRTLDIIRHNNTEREQEAKWDKIE